MGQIAAAAGAKRSIESPLTVEIEMFVKMTAFIATLTGLVFFCLGYFFIDSDFLDQFVFLVGGLSPRCPVLDVGCCQEWTKSKRDK